MPNLTIDNTVTIVNNPIGLTVTPSTTASLSAVTVRGPAGPPGVSIQGPAGSGVPSLNSLTGAIALTGAGSISVFVAPSLITISGDSSAGGVTQGQLDSLSGYSKSALNATGEKITALSGYATGLSVGGVGSQTVLRATTGQLLEVLGDSVSGVAPPSGSFIIPILQPIRGSSTTLLGEPDGWWVFMISGRVGKIPYYY